MTLETWICTNFVFHILQEMDTELCVSIPFPACSPFFIEAWLYSITDGMQEALVGVPQEPGCQAL